MADASAPSAPAPSAGAAAAAGYGAASGDDAAFLKAALRRHGRDPEEAVDEGELADLLCNADPAMSRDEVDTLLAHVQRNNPEHFTFAELVDSIFDVLPENQQDSHADGGPGDPSSSLGRASARPAVDPPRREPGAQIQQRRENEDTKYEVWLASVSVPERYRKIPHAIQDTADRGISVEQLESLGTFVQEVLENSEVVKTASVTDRDDVQQTWLTVNLYTICNFFVKPLTKDYACSFVERLAFSAQVPMWFISHFWGTPFRESLRMLRFHCEKRGLGLNAYYWMCTFANNQHNLSELGGGLADTPFMRVLRSIDCKGTVALMDALASPFRRVWCVLECHASMMRNFHYDIAAWIPEGMYPVGGRDNPEQAAVQLDEGNFVVRELTESGCIFPPTVAAEGIKTDITKAQASMQADYDAIMLHIKGSEASLNGAIRRRFAPAAMYGAAWLGDAAEIRRLLGNFPESKDVATAAGCTPAGRAAQGGHAAVVKALVEARADLHIPDQSGATPAFLAAQNGDGETLNVLVKAGADVNKARHNGCTPAVMAAQYGHSEALTALMEAGADINKANRDGFTPALMAAQNGHGEALQALVKARADLDMVNGDGATAAAMAAYDGHAGALQVLAEARADLLKPVMGWTPAQLAAGNGHNEALAVLRAAGAASQT